MDRAELTHPVELCDPARVLGVRLHRHCRQSRLDVAGLQKNRLETGLHQRREQPLRQWAGSNPDACDRNAEPLEKQNQRVWVALNLRLLHDCTLRVDNANA